MLAREFAVAKNLDEEARTDGFSRMNRHHRKSSLNPVALIFSQPGSIVDGFVDFRPVRAGGRKAG